MYETEVNRRVESSAQIPSAVLAAFQELDGKILSRTLLPWSEHCTECVWPTCYTTCDLYQPREDGRCRRFVDGMVRIDGVGNDGKYLLKIRFKRWGKVWAPGTLRFYSSSEAKKIESRDYWIGSTLQKLPLPAPLKRTAVGKRYIFKKRLAQRGPFEEQLGGSFLLECYNPQERVIPLSLTIRALNGSSKIPFQELIHLAPGFRRVRIAVNEIAGVVDLRKPFSIEMIPNDVPDGTTLYFGIMDFVQEAELGEEPTRPRTTPVALKTNLSSGLAHGSAVSSHPQAGKGQAVTVREVGEGAWRENQHKGYSPKSSSDAKKVKCIVWDLDNTLWDGILIEDGAEKLRLKPGVADVIRQLDGRGILHSVASKNNAEEATEVLKRFKLDEYFLYPQISWQPKSNGIEAIANLLSIGKDTLLFVDDSEFELQEVATVHPQVRTLCAERYLELVQMAECQVPVTAEAATRRSMYRVEADRKAAAEGFGSDYQAFLRDCNIRLNIRPLDPLNLDRVHELTQRTNQMNFSGNRYDREVLREILSKSYLDTYVLECEDRFGSYGVIGFSIVDGREPRMTDLMFSCRIQAKRVEHAFLAFLIRKYIAESGKDFLADYRKTPRNEPSGRVFTDLGMENVEEREGVSLLVFPRDRTVPEDGVIHITVHEEAEKTVVGSR